MDHVPIMLRKVVEPPPGILNDEQLLKRILAEVRAIKAKITGEEPKREAVPKPNVSAKRKKKAKKEEVA